MSDPALLISAEREIAAPPEKIFDILADPSKHSLIDGSGSVQRPCVSAPARLSLGAKFQMAMRIGVPYTITNTVVEFEEGKKIGWRHFGAHVWRYELTPTERGTLVRESVDYNDSTWPWAIRLLRYPGRTQHAIEETLRCLDEAVTGGS